MWFKPQDVLALSPGEGPGDKVMLWIGREGPVRGEKGLGMRLRMATRNTLVGELVSTP